MIILSGIALVGISLGSTTQFFILLEFLWSSSQELLWLGFRWEVPRNFLFSWSFCDHPLRNCFAGWDSLGSTTKFIAISYARAILSTSWFNLNDRIALHCVADVRRGGREESRAREGREEWVPFPPSSRALCTLALYLTPFPSPSNACHAA